jgi:hypothetical protein
MFFFFSKGLGFGISAVISILVTLLLVKSCAM